MTTTAAEQAADVPPGVKIADAPLASVPTTEQLLDLEGEIQRLIERKRRTDLHIIDLEARIHAVETNFLKETTYFGAIMNGLEGYLSTVGGTSAVVGRRPREVKDNDRFLSNTSASQPRALAVHSRLVREGILNPIPLKSSEKKSSGGGNGGSSSHRKRPRSNDPAWLTPSRNRQ